MKKVLVVAYHYPPLAGAGVLRTLKFTKYLPDFGFHPIVLTVGNRSVGSVDETLVRDIPAQIKVVSTFSAEHRVLRAPRLVGVDPRWFFTPDVHVGWIPFAVHRGLSLIRDEGIDVIFATAPVFTSLIVGHMLKKRSGRPLVLDFRDPWTQNVFHPHPTFLHRQVEEHMERMVLQSADYVVTATDETRSALSMKHPYVGDKSLTISNGFDSSDFRDLSKMTRSQRFTITYTGDLYGLRTAEHFLRALANAVDGQEDLRDKIRVIFAGAFDKRMPGLLRRLRLDDIVSIVGFVAHRESLRLMVNADVLLLLMSRSEVVGNGMRTMMIPGKTYEYLGARRPILALAPEGSASDLVTRTGAGIVVAPDEPEAIAAAILHFFRDWQAQALHVAPCDLAEFERKALAGRLASVLYAVCG